MNDQQQTSGAVAQAAGPGADPLSDGTVAVYQSMLDAVPDAESGAGYERILQQLAAADDLTGLNSPWEAGDFREWADEVLVIRGITKRPAEFEGGLPWFLVVDAVDEATGNMLTLTTGSVNIVAQLTRAWSLDLFPIRAKVVIAAKPTRSGFYPQRLQFLGKPKGADNGKS